METLGALQESRAFAAKGGEEVWFSPGKELGAALLSSKLLGGASGVWGEDNSPA